MLDALVITGDVRDREQTCELLNDLRLMFGAPLMSCDGCLL